MTRPLHLVRSQGDTATHKDRKREREGERGRERDLLTGAALVIQFARATLYVMRDFT